MAKFDFEKMKGSLQDAAGNVANAAKGAADSVANAAKGIKMPDLFSVINEAPDEPGYF